MQRDDEPGINRKRRKLPKAPRMLGTVIVEDVYVEDFGVDNAGKDDFVNKIVDIRYQPPQSRARSRQSMGFTSAEMLGGLKKTRSTSEMVSVQVSYESRQADYKTDYSIFRKKANLIVYLIDCRVPLVNQMEQLRALCSEAGSDKPRLFVVTNADAVGNACKIHLEDKSEDRCQLEQLFGPIPKEDLIWFSAKSNRGFDEVRHGMIAKLNECNKQKVLDEAKEDKRLRAGYEAAVRARYDSALRYFDFEMATTALAKDKADEVKGVLQDVAEIQAFVAEESKKNPVDQFVLEMTKSCREDFCRHLIESRKEILKILKEDTDPFIVEHAFAIAEAIAELAPKVASGKVENRDLVNFNRKINPILLKEAKVALWAGRLTGAALGVCIGGMLGMLCGPAAPFTVPAFMAVGTIVGAVLGAGVFGYLGGKMGQKMHMMWSERQAKRSDVKHSPHRLRELRNAAKGTLKEKREAMDDIAKQIEAGTLHTIKPGGGGGGGK